MIIMKKALLIGNCQNHSLIGFLNKNEEFRRTYETKFYANWEMIERKDSIPTMELMNADLFIYHPLAPVHGCYSTDPNVEGSIGSLVKEGCLKISHPYVYSSAMWPLIQQDHNGRDWFGSEVIDGLIANGMKLDDILNEYRHNRIDWQYKSRFEETRSILKMKESQTDVVITDFLDDRLKDSLLFLTHQHPTSLVLNELANRILSMLGMEGNLPPDDINESRLEDSTYSRPSMMFPIHRSAVEYYNLTYADRYIDDSDSFYEQRIIQYYNQTL